MSLAIKIMECFDTEIGEALCSGCSRWTIFRGSRDELGVPLEPDEEACGLGLDHPAEPQCLRHNTYLEICERAKDMADLVNLAKGGVSAGTAQGRA